MKSVKFFAVAAAIGVAAWVGATSAQSYPDKPVKIVASFPPGSAIDIVARIIADKLTPGLGQPVVVENRPGAGGNVGTAIVAAAPADGYTLLVTSSAIASAPALYKTLNYDPVKDFATVGPAAVLPNVLVVAANNDKGIKTVADLVSYAKKNPGKLSYASAGVGSATHMSDEKFKVVAGFDAVHVAYKGTPDAMNDIMGGRVDFMFTTMASGIPLIQGGKLLALSVGADQRSPLLPNVPTTAEAGVKDADYALWVGVFAPAKTPKPVIDKLNQELTKALQAPDMKERLAKIGADPWLMKPEAFAAQIQKEIVANIDLVKKAKIEPN